jgi:hypothetical protein
MATSKSAEKCTATVAIFSGRPDPSWDLRRSLLHRLESIWKRLSPAAGLPPVAPALGYRGCVVKRGPRAVWEAFGGVVVRGKERRADPRREFERAVLNSAPKGVLPEEVLRMFEEKTPVSSIPERHPGN